MMAWFKKRLNRQRVTPPEVPDDLAERREKLQQSKERLAEAEALAVRSTASAAVMHDNNRVNHYIRRLEESYAQGGLRG